MPAVDRWVSWTNGCYPPRIDSQRYSPPAMDYSFVVACFRKFDAVAVVEIAVDWVRDPFGSDSHPLQLALQYLARVLMDPGM